MLNNETQVEKTDQKAKSPVHASLSVYLKSELLGTLNLKKKKKKNT